MRDDNSDWKQQQDEEQEWHENNRRLLDVFDEVRPLIKTVQPDSCKQLASLTGAYKHPF